MKITGRAEDGIEVYAWTYTLAVLDKNGSGGSGEWLIDDVDTDSIEERHILGLYRHGVSSGASAVAEYVLERYGICDEDLSIYINQHLRGTMREAIENTRGNHEND